MSQANSSIGEDSTFITEVSFTNREAITSINEAASSISDIVYSIREAGGSFSEADLKLNNCLCYLMYKFIRTPPTHSQLN